MKGEQKESNVNEAAHLANYTIKDLVFISAGLATLASVFLSTATFFITRQMTIRGLEGKFISKKDCEACRTNMESYENKVKEFLKSHQNEFKVVRLALSELFEVNGIPREKIEQIREDVFINNK